MKPQEIIAILIVAGLFGSCVKHAGPVMSEYPQNQTPHPAEIDWKVYQYKSVTLDSNGQPSEDPEAALSDWGYRGVVLTPTGQPCGTGQLFQASIESSIREGPSNFPANGTLCYQGRDRWNFNPAQ